ncbi:hypothetical protein PCANC_26906 [Puccinia coronata f. sp. avenae]|uniref:FAR1 domain-containing protein n=1 Tax=Puccinia coronata f. sp. avenae TaxID=200324 RepID=A0A2N5TH26_9BASI|nr:hypothetical protein PCANC_26906 [Puccinia coronata f. sp. avenae]
MSTNINPSNVNNQSNNSSTTPHTGGVIPQHTGGITVTPQVWVQMQSLLALLPAQPTMENPRATVDDSPNPGTGTVLVPNVVSSSLPSITLSLPPDLKKETKLEDGYHLPNCGKIVPQDEVKIIQDSISNSPLPPSIIHEAEAPAHPVITPASIIHKETPALIIIKEDPAPPVINTDIEKYDFGTGRPLDPPPSSHFTSMDDLVCFCQLWAKSHGYAVFKSNSHLGKNVYIKCNQSGHFRGAVLNQSGRKTATLKINCPFQIKGSIPTSKKITSKFWTLEILNGTHKFSHGHMIANSYRRPICFISLNKSHSFFPLQLGPTSEDPAPLYLIYINGNHGVLGDVVGEDGVKPIPPPFLASRHTSKTAKGWFEHLKPGLDLYQSKQEAKLI